MALSELFCQVIVCFWILNGGKFLNIDTKNKQLRSKVNASHKNVLKIFENKI